MNSINFTEHQPSLSGQTIIKKCEHCRIINIELVERLRKCSGCNVVYYLVLPANTETEKTIDHIVKE